MSRDYGDRFETPIIIIMSLAILAALGGVASMVAAYTPDCSPSYQTYCGDTPEHH